MSTIIFSVNEAIVPLSASSMYRMGKSDFLNPVNRTEGNTLAVSTDKLIRAVARAIYAITVPLLCAAAGIAYHGLAAILLHIWTMRHAEGTFQHAYYAAKTDAHAFAAMIDAVSLILDVGTCGLIPLIRGLACTSSKGCAAATAPYYSSQVVKTSEGASEQYRSFVYHELLKRA